MTRRNDLRSPRIGRHGSPPPPTPAPLVDRCSHPGTRGNTRLVSAPGYRRQHPGNQQRSGGTWPNHVSSGRARIGRSWTVDRSGTFARWTRNLRENVKTYCTLHSFTCNTECRHRTDCRKISQPVHEACKRHNSVTFAVSFITIACNCWSEFISVKMSSSHYNKRTLCKLSGTTTSVLFAGDTYDELSLVRAIIIYFCKTGTCPCKK